MESRDETECKDSEVNPSLPKLEKIRGISEEAIWSDNVVLSANRSTVNAGMRDRCTSVFMSKKIP